MQGTKIILILLASLVSQSQARYAHPGNDLTARWKVPDGGKPRWKPQWKTTSTTVAPTSSSVTSSPTLLASPTLSASLGPLPTPRYSTHAYCTPNTDPKMCALGIGIKNPTVYYSDIKQNTIIDVSFWDSKCMAYGDLGNITMDRYPYSDSTLGPNSHMSISIDRPPASYESCYDGPGMEGGDHTTCDSEDWAQFDCGCSPSDKSKNGAICEPVLYSKCVLKPGHIEFNVTSSKNTVTTYESPISIGTRAGKDVACNCDKKYQNDCPKEYAFCCGCEFACGE